MIHTKGLLALPASENIEEVVNGLSAPIQLTKGKYGNLEFHFKNNEVTVLHRGIDIKEFSHIWLSSLWNTRDLAYAVKLYLKQSATQHTFVEKVTSKMTDQMKFTLNRIPTPATFFVNSLNITKHVDTIEEICGFPLIIKDVVGSCGKHSVLVNSKDELVEKLKALPRKRKYFYQQFIPNDYDWGVLVSNGKVVSAEMSYPKDGEFRNNATNGAREVFVDLKNVPLEIKEIAIKASRALKLSWSRSDIVIDRNTGKAYLMEVNRFPGITSGSGEVCGAQSFLENHMGFENREGASAVIDLLI